MKTLKINNKLLNKLYRNYCLFYKQRLQNIICLICGVLLLSLSFQTIVYAQGDVITTAEPEYNPELINCAVAQLFRLIEGSFGALIMVVSGLGAIMAAAFGAYRASLGMLVVAVGSFILRSLVSLFFGSITCDIESI